LQLVVGAFAYSTQITEMAKKGKGNPSDSSSSDDDIFIPDDTDYIPDDEDLMSEDEGKTTKKSGTSAKLKGAGKSSTVKPKVNEKPKANEEPKANNKPKGNDGAKTTDKPNTDAGPSNNNQPGSQPKKKSRKKKLTKYEQFGRPEEQYPDFHRRRSIEGQQRSAAFTHLRKEGEPVTKRKRNHSPVEDSFEEVLASGPEISDATGITQLIAQVKKLAGTVAAL